MAGRDRSTGPIPREEFAKLAAAPYGEAEKVIRRYDPLWGRKEGEKIKWRVKFSQEVRMVGYATVEAETQQEAEDLADDVSDAAISWDHQDSGDSEVEEVTPL